LQCVCCSVSSAKHTNTRSVLCCSVLQCVADCCSVLQCAAVCHSAPQCVAAWSYFPHPQRDTHGVLQCVAVCCSVLQHSVVSRTHNATFTHNPNNVSSQPSVLGLAEPPPPPPPLQVHNLKSQLFNHFTSSIERRAHTSAISQKRPIIFCKRDP